MIKKLIFCLLLFGILLPGSSPGVASADDVLSKYTFVPGEKFLITEDLSTTAIGEAPATLHVNGNAEIVLINQERWLKLGPGVEINLNIQQPAEDLTLELYTRVSNAESRLSFYLMNEDKGLDVRIYTGSEEVAWEGFYKDNDLPTNRASKRFYGINEIVPIAVTIQKERVKFFINKQLVMNVAGYTPVMPQNIIIRVDNSEEDDLIAIKDLRLATVVPDIAGEILNKGKYTSHGVYFDTGSAKVKDESYAVLKQVADVMTANTDLKILIAGHTDNTGTIEGNKKLSLDRAESVKQYLVSRFGIAVVRLSTKGAGDTEPIADNKTVEGRAKNRRVEFIKN